MYLTQVVLILVATAAVCAFGLRLFAERSLPVSAGRAAWATDATGVVAVAVFLVFMSTRSLQFGVDTIAYAELFALHCEGIPLDDRELSFTVSSILLDAAMLGGCYPPLLPAAWAGLMAAILVVGAGGALRFRWRYATLLLVSMVGIELTTNALRQGLGMACLVAAVGSRRERPVVSFALAGLAIILHSATALVLVALMLSLLPWRWFLAGIGAAVWWVLSAMDDSAPLRLAEPFLYEVIKYAAHAGDEIWIRILTGTAIVGAIAAAWLTDPTFRPGSVWRLRSFQVALRLSATVVPFMFLPYFGYRYAYGVFPLVLWLTMEAVDRHPAAMRLRMRQFWWALVINVTLILAWSQGSSYMREVEFFRW